MSSELFENYEFDFNNTLSTIKKLNAQIPNYNGEQKKAAIRSAEKEIEKADELLQEMEVETRNAPPAFRSKLQAKLTRYHNDIDKIQREIKSAGDRRELLGGGGDYDEPQSYDQRSRLLDSADRQNRTSDRLANTARIAQESEEIGQGILSELGTQRETIVRTAQKVYGVDSNLGKSQKILNSMSRRIMTNKMIMISIIFVLMGILGITIYFKLK